MIVEALPTISDQGLSPSRKAKTARNVLIAEDYVSGVKVEALAKKYNLSEKQIKRILSENDAAKTILTWAIQRNIQGLPKAVKRHDELIQDDDKNVALNALKLRYQISSVLPSHAQNQYVTNLYVDQRKVTIAAPILEALSGSLEDVEDAEIIEP